MHWLCAWPLYGWMLLGAPCSNRRRSAAPMTLQASGTLRSSPFCSVITNRLFGAGDLVSRIPPATSAAITMAVPPQVTSLRLDRRRRAAATLLRRGFLPGRPGRPWSGPPNSPGRPNSPDSSSSAASPYLGRSGTRADLADLGGLRAGRSGSMPPGTAHGGRSDSASDASSKLSSTCQPVLRGSCEVLDRPERPGLSGWRGG